MTIENGKGFQKITELIKLVDSFKEDPNFEVNLEINYKNSDGS